MKKILKVALSSLVFVCSFFTVAGDELDAINAKVEQKAAQIDQDYGVLLTGHERNNLKISLIVDKLNKEHEDVPVKQKADKAIQTYEITDPIDQRKLLIEMEAASLTGGGGGDDPSSRLTGNGDGDDPK